MIIDLCFNKNISFRSLGGERRMDRKIPQSNYWKTGNSYWRVSGFMYFVLHSIALIYYNVLSSLRSIVCQIVTNRRSNTRKSFKLSAIKVVASLTRDNAVIWLESFGIVKNWWLCGGGHLSEVVATGDSTVFSKCGQQVEVRTTITY